MTPPQEPPVVTVTVCVGSSCHLKGSREVVERFSSLLSREDLQKRVELKGSFCMEQCGEGINWRIDDEIVSSQSADEAVETLQRKISEMLGLDDCEQSDSKTKKT